MTPGRLARLSGRVVDPSGNPVSSARIVLTSAAGASSMVGMSAADGSFAAAGLAPGQYTLQATPLAAAATSGESAWLPVTLTGDDLPGLQLVLGANATLSGNVVFDGTPGPALFRVTAQRADGQQGLVSLSADPRISGEILGDSFRLVSAPGRVLLGVSGPGEWVVRSITANGKDLLDTPVELDHGQTLANIRIVITDKVATVSGRATDATGRPQKNYAVVIMPADARDPVVVSRLSRFVRPDTDGVFEITGLRSGRYVAAAFDALDAGQRYAPAVQDRIRQRGRTFTLAEGQAVTLDLPMVVTVK